jgi:hypothetical protein
MKISARLQGITTMLAVLILSSTFFAGFFVGYAVRAWRSHKRRAHYLAYAQYRARPQNDTFRQSGPQTSMFGHARRAF